jgi:glutathione S-transferase
MLELYHSGLTTCSKQARLTLREKGVDYVTRYVELWNFENLNPEYIKLNPHGVVPTLVHDGVPIHNAVAIMEYVEDAFPGPALRPADLKARSIMRAWMAFSDETHHSVITTTYNAMLRAQMEMLEKDEVEKIIAASPMPERAERWRKAAMGGDDEHVLAAAAANLTFAIGRMEKDLAAGGPWIVGEDYSLADISLLSIVHRIRELRPDLAEPGDYPAVNDWFGCMNARPAVIEVYKADGLETPPRPKTKTISGLG